MSGEAIVQNAIIGVLSGDTCLTTDRLASVVGKSSKEISKACCRLVSRDLVERMEIGCFKLTEEGKLFKAQGGIIKSGPSGPSTSSKPRRRRRTLRDRAWRVIRRKRKFTLNDLERLASNGDERNARDNIRKYIRVLTKAGYLLELSHREEGTALTSNGFKRFSLVRDTGSLTPVHQAHLGCVVDRNNGEAYPCG